MPTTTCFSFNNAQTFYGLFTVLATKAAAAASSNEKVSF